VKRFALVATMGLVSAVVLAGCTSETPGLPSGTTVSTGDSPGGGPFPTGGQSTPKSSATTTPSGPMANTSPCSLVSAADVSALGLKDQREDKSLKSPACVYSYSASTGSLRVVIYNTLSIKDIQDRTQLTSIPVGKHEAVRGFTAAGGCAIAIKVTDTSRVDVVAGINGDEQKSCELALPAAQAVEKNLPVG
jgi:hypothetical protein